MGVGGGRRVGRRGADQDREAEKGGREKNAGKEGQGGHVRGCGRDALFAASPLSLSDWHSGASRLTAYSVSRCGGDAPKRSCQRLLASPALRDGRCITHLQISRAAPPVLPFGALLLIHHQHRISHPEVSAPTKPSFDQIHGAMTGTRIQRVCDYFCLCFPSPIFPPRIWR